MLFRKEKTYLFDCHALADGRIVGIIKSGLITGKFILLTEPLALLHKQVNLDEASITRINENRIRIQDIQKKNIIVINKQLNKQEFTQLIKRYQPLIITTTYEIKENLITAMSDTNRIELKIIALNQLYEILKPDYLPGTELKVMVTKKGKELDEGIGYLESGTKVIIAGGAKSIGKEIEVIVQGSLETTVGKLIFARPKYIEVK
ncbi:MAG: TRAM domain-containing protein [candidate division WOR-3 bacterium]|nr:TRAM domain-containing protein [candidate division WOR-3 bacterium]